MEIEFSVPLDADGFLRRECPTCERQFKWFHGETAERPADAVEPTSYFCPYCGEPAPTDHWWTTEQLEQAAGEAAGPVSKAVERALRDAFRSSKSGLVSFELDRVDAASPPPPLVEPNDMIMLEPPCHSYEPVKVMDGWHESIHCLVCGAAYTVS